MDQESKLRIKGREERKEVDQIKRLINQQEDKGKKDKIKELRNKEEDKEEEKEKVEAIPVKDKIRTQDLVAEKNI